MKSIRLSIGGVAMAALFLCSACGGGRVVTKEEVQAQKRAEAQQSAEAERARLAAQDAKWTGRTVGWEEPFELRGTNEAKLEGEDYVVGLIKTSWSAMETPKGEVRTGTAKLLVTVGDELKEVSIEEGESRVVFGHRIEVTFAYEDYDSDRAEYEPLVKLVVHRQ